MSGSLSAAAEYQDRDGGSQHYLLPADAVHTEVPTPKTPTPALTRHPVAIFTPPALTLSIWASVSLAGAARAAEVIRPSANAEAKIVFMVVLP